MGLYVFERSIRTKHSMLLGAKEIKKMIDAIVIVVIVVVAHKIATYAVSGKFKMINKGGK